MPSLRPFLFRVSVTTIPGFVEESDGSPGRICQWSNTHCGKAWPPVLDRRSAVNPTTKNKLTFNRLHQHTFACHVTISHLYRPQMLLGIAPNTICSPPKLIIVFTIFLDDCNTQEKLETILVHFLSWGGGGGGIKCIMGMWKWKIAGQISRVFKNSRLFTKPVFLTALGNW